MEGVTSIRACYCHRQRKTTEIVEGEAHDYKHMTTSTQLKITSEAVPGPKLASSENTYFLSSSSHNTS